MRTGMVLLVAASAGLLTGGTPPATIYSVTLSQDQMRLEVILTTCNADIEVTIAETDSTVTISMDDRRPPIQISSQDCLDIFIVPLDSRLGERQVIEATSGDQVAVTSVLADALNWPYDRSRFTAADYQAALDGMVACVMAEDPAVTAWVEQDLHWKVWNFSKPPDADGSISMFATRGCQEKHLDPLT